MDVPPRDIFMSIRSPNPLEETIERIADAIKTRLLSPGDRLPPERELAVQLGVSRSTLRVALRNLVAAGWLEVRRGRSGGAFVARWPTMPSPRKLPEVLTRRREGLPALLDYRCAVESAAAAFAAARATPAEITELEALTSAIDGYEREFEAYRASDARFHIGIARAAHSPRILEAVTEVQAAMTEVLDVIVYHSAEVLRHSTDYHWRILDAIRAHDSEAARRAMLDHVMATENVIYGLVPEVASKEAAPPPEARELSA
jgi:DNA-binding FadR family transcriptional regulator